VQGVGFRAFASREARSLGLDGFVRNLPDGSVEIEAEGSRAALEHLLARVSRGPALAAPSRVEAQWLESAQAHQGFHVRG
jgi:acylphosphatase